MSIDEVTANLAYPLPNAANSLAYDVARLITLIGKLDIDIQALNGIAASSSNALYLGGNNSAWHVSLANATGVLAVEHGGTGGATQVAAQTALGLLGMATQAPDDVNVTGGTIDGGSF